MNDELCWVAVAARDKSQDDRFFYGVITTGVYCRPSCGSRRPLRKNVRFYASTADAERDGLRACLRCRPKAPAARDAMAEKVQQVCRYIEGHADEDLTLAALSRRVRTSPFHLQRSFKAIVGVTPKQFAEASRLKTLRGTLRDGRSVTDAIYDAGFGSSSRVYGRVDTRLGMTPKQYRQGGKGVAISYAVSETTLGTLMMAATDRGLCSVQIGERAADLVAGLAKEFPGAAIARMRPQRGDQFARWMRSLAEHLEGVQQRIEIPLDIRGTAFQVMVWNYLQRIPYGEVRSYAEVARAIGRPAAVRAVGSACARNRLALVIPCHRVIRGDGALGGYRWGLERKRALIERERTVRAGTR
mgnify:CR=1 FL=1